MRAFHIVTLGVLIFGSLPASAAEPSGSSLSANPVIRYLREPAWPLQGGGGVTFATGNDFWQPGQRYKAGRDWLALACDAGGCALEPAALSVEGKFWQGHYDDKPTFGQRLLFKIEKSSNAAAVAWFNTATAPAWLKPGAVKTYYSPQRPLRQPPGRGTLEASIDLPNGETALLVPMLVTKALHNQAQPENRADWPAVVLQLRAGGRRQLLSGRLGTCWGTFHPSRYLLWAGDLDRDGKPDYLVSFIDNEGPVHLYLSSGSGPGQLVRLAGVYQSPPFGGECSSGGFMESLEAENR